MPVSNMKENVAVEDKLALSIEIFSFICFAFDKMERRGKAIAESVGTVLK